MKANELRVGNIIDFINPSKIIERTVVAQISSEKFGAWNGSYEISVGKPDDYYDCDLTDLIPIPLTEEILFKVGFEKVPHFTIMNSLVYKLGRNRQLSLGCTGTPNEMLFITEVDDDDKPTKVNDLICLHNFDYDGKLHLHKLQNIVAIFGQELNTNNII